MRNLWLTVIILMFTTCYSISAQDKPSVSPERKVVNECGATFSLPADYKEENARGIDSCLKRYRGTNTSLTLDVLSYITPDASRRDEYADERDVKYKKTIIDGRKAEIITFYADESEQKTKGFPFSAVLFVPQMTKDGGNLTIWTNSNSADEREQALKIFQTVQFAKR